MLSIIPSIFKSALPLTVTVAPLLLAAAEPPAFDAVGACSLDETSSLATGVQRLVDFSAIPVAQPVDTVTRVLVTSEQEMEFFLSDRQTTRSQIRLDNLNNIYELDPASGDRSVAAQQGCSAGQIAPQLEETQRLAILSRTDIAQMPDEDAELPTLTIRQTHCKTAPATLVEPSSPTAAVHCKSAAPALKATGSTMPARY